MVQIGLHHRLDFGWGNRETVAQLSYCREFPMVRLPAAAIHDLLVFGLTEILRPRWGP